MGPGKLAILLLALVLCVVIAFCLFGFLATYEPWDRDVVAWRLGYGALAALSVVGIALLGVRFRSLP